MRGMLAARGLEWHASVELQRGTTVVIGRKTQYNSVLVELLRKIGFYLF